MIIENVFWGAERFPFLIQINLQNAFDEKKL